MCCGGSEEEEDPPVPPGRDPTGKPKRSNPSPPRPGDDVPDNVGGDDSGRNQPDPATPGSSRPTFPISFPDAGRPKRRIRRLYCRTGYDLAVFPNGKVVGTKNPRNKYGNLEFESAGINGEVRIKGVVTGFYVTMTPKGRVRAQPLTTSRGTVWVETKIGTGTAYMSLLSLDYAHHGYYLALKKSGKPKAGPKTAHPYPQKAISFLPRIVAEE